MTVCVFRMEGGELFHRIKSQQQLQESVAKLYFYQMLRAVQVSPAVSLWLLRSPGLQHNVSVCGVCVCVCVCVCGVWCL